MELQITLLWLEFLFNSLREPANDLPLSLNEKHKYSTFLGKNFSQKDVFVSSSVLEFFGGDTLGLIHTL